MLSPRQIFEDNIRPSTLLLKVFRLLEHERPDTEGERVDTLRKLVDAAADEELMVIYNEVFLGLIRERADVSRATIRRSALCNPLCTALETYLPVLLQQNLENVIKAKGRQFKLPEDEALESQFAPLQFTLSDALRLLEDPDPLFVANKVIRSLKIAYLTGKRGIHVTGLLLDIEDPWKQIAGRLHRDMDELQSTVHATVNRRNDIVHRADRDRKSLDGEAQDIAYAWTTQAVDTIRHVCLCLDELVAERMAELTHQATEGETTGTSEKSIEQLVAEMHARKHRDG